MSNYVASMDRTVTQSWHVQCPRCGWRGTGADAVEAESVLRCPRCPTTDHRARLIRDEDAAIRLSAPKVATILDCPRCSGMHELLPFDRVENATDRWTYRGVCPASGEAVWLSVEPE